MLRIETSSRCRWAACFHGAALLMLGMIMIDPAHADDCAITRKIVEAYVANCAWEGCRDEAAYRQLLIETCGPQAASEQVAPRAGADDHSPVQTPSASQPEAPPNPREHQGTDCGMLTQLRDEGLERMWNRAVREQTGLTQAQELNRKVLADIQSGAITLSVASTAILGLKVIHDHLQVVAKLICVPLKGVNQVACAIQDQSSKLNDQIKLRSIKDAEERAKFLARKAAEEAVKQTQVGKILVPLEKYTEENVKTGVMAQDYAESRRFVEDQLRQMQNRIDAADRRLKSLETRRLAVNRLRSWIDEQCSQPNIQLQNP